MPILVDGSQYKGMDDLLLLARSRTQDMIFHHKAGMRCLPAGMRCLL